MTLRVAILLFSPFGVFPTLHCRLDLDSKDLETKVLRLQHLVFQVRVLYTIHKNLRRIFLNQSINLTSYRRILMPLLIMCIYLTFHRFYYGPQKSPEASFIPGLRRVHPTSPIKVSLSQRLSSFRIYF